MIHLENEGIIYVACPRETSTGGPETLHQLVNSLRKDGKEAYIYYFNAKKNTDNLIPIKFKSYNIKYVTEIEDNNKNIIIIPETYTELLYKYKKIRKVIWWLSVDFYKNSLLNTRTKITLNKKNIPQLFFPITKYYFMFRDKCYKQLDFNKDSDINKYFYLYNCEYAKEFLLSNNIEEERMRYLCGPIRNEFYDLTLQEIQKKNIVAYNPAKGYEYTKKIIEKMRNIDNGIKFIPIKNLTSEEIVTLLKEAKLYIDFGFFPGPERIPREAVSCYCNIITSRTGSAGNEVDVPIPNSFKFEPVDENLNEICELVIEQLRNYPKYINNYNCYREKVNNQIQFFDKTIKEIFK